MLCSINRFTVVQLLQAQRRLQCIFNMFSIIVAMYREKLSNKTSPSPSIEPVRAKKRLKKNKLTEKKTEIKAKKFHKRRESAISHSMHFAYQFCVCFFIHA